MSENNKNINNPFTDDDNKETNGQNPQQPMPMYYAYPPMPQQGEGGQPMPMYYPYPPMPQQGEGGQPMPMYYAYPPMPQQGEGGQPMPMYYACPPMPPQEQQAQGNTYINQPTQYPNEQRSPAQVSENPPSKSFSNESVTGSSNPFLVGAEEEQKNINENATQKVDEQEVFVRQPVINVDGFINNDRVSREESFEKDKDDLIISEPRKDDTIFSAPTPIFDPLKGIDKEQTSFVELKEEQNEPQEQSNSFLSSMHNLYTAIGGASGDNQNKNISQNVSDEPLPAFTAPIESVTNEVEIQKTVYSTPVSQSFEPTEFNPTEMQIQNQAQTEEKPKDDFSLERMFGQQDKKEPAQEDLFGQGGAFENKDFVDFEAVEEAKTKAEPQEIYSSSQGAQNQEHEIEKDQQYWEFMNNLLDRFDDGKVYTNIGAQPESVNEVEQLQQRIKAIENNARPDEGSLSDFGRNIEKPTQGRVTIPRTPNVFKKNATDFDIENPDFEHELDIFSDDKRKEKKPSAKKEKEKSPKVKKEKNKAKDFSTGSKLKKITATTLPMRGDSTGEIIRKLVVIISVIVLLGCGIYFLNYFINVQQNKKDSEEFAKILQSSETEDWATIKSKYPNITFPEGMLPKYADLYAINQDLVGWVKVEGLDINLPVVQGDNDSYYLKHNFRKEKSKYGSIFLSSNNNFETIDLNTVLFGHRMRSDTQMFTNLREYATPEGFVKAPLIEFNTIYGDYAWKVYAVFITNGTASGDNGNVFNYTFSNLLTFENYGYFIAEVNQRKLYDTGVELNQDDKILTLSTCTYEFDDARLVVIARQVRAGESREVDTSNIKINKNPRYPQAWYDKKGIANPYKNFDVWAPVY